MLPQNGWFTSVRKVLKNWVAIATLTVLLLSVSGIIVDEALRQREAVRLFNDASSLVPGSSSLDETLKVVQKHHFERRVSGETTTYVGDVQVNPVLRLTAALANHYIGLKAKWFEMISIKPWELMVIIRVSDDKVESTQFLLGTSYSDTSHPYDGWHWNSVEVQMVAAMPAFRNASRPEAAQLSRHPNYVVQPAGGALFVTVSAHANNEERRNLLRFDANCLSRQRCAGWGRAFPDIWQNYCQEISEFEYFQSPGLRRECSTQD